MLHITVTIIRQCKSNLSVVEFSVPCHNHTGCAAIVIGKDKIMVVLSQQYIFIMMARGNVLRKKEKKKTSYFKLSF